MKLFLCICVGVIILVAIITQKEYYTINCNSRNNCEGSKICCVNPEQTLIRGKRGSCMEEIDCISPPNHIQ